MKINDIQVSGSTNVLKWAIKNKANIKGDLSLQSIINDEMSFNIFINDVNFFELFRLTQMYRDGLRITNIHQAAAPEEEELDMYFMGDCIIDETKPDKVIPARDVANCAISAFMKLAYQMQADEDLIRPNSLVYFLPMISRKFDIQVPVHFLDIMDCMNADEARKVFTEEDFPTAFVDLVVDTNSDINRILMLNFLRGSAIVKNSAHYDELLKAIKYGSLNHYTKDTIYRFALLDFYKKNTVSKEQIKVSMFRPDTEEIPKLLKKIGRTEGSLYVDFVVELPIEDMQVIENSISRELLPIAYESSMTSILDGGIKFDDFKTPELSNPESSIHDTEFNEEDGLKVVEYNNKVSDYKIRINEANQVLLNSIPILLAGNNPENMAPENLDVDPTATFSMLPSIYRTKAVFNIRVDYIPNFINSNNPLISKLFTDINEQVQLVISDIKKAST